MESRVNILCPNCGHTNIDPWAVYCTLCGVKMFTEMGEPIGRNIASAAVSAAAAVSEEVADKVSAEEIVESVISETEQAAEAEEKPVYIGDPMVDEKLEELRNSLAEELQSPDTEEKPEMKSVPETDRPEPVLVCPECGRTETDPNLRFCESCGRTLAPLPGWSARAAEKKEALELPVCPKCSAVGKQGQKFCIRCGTRMAGPTGKVASIPKPPETTPVLEVVSLREDNVEWETPELTLERADENGPSPLSEKITLNLEKSPDADAPTDSAGITLQVTPIVLTEDEPEEAPLAETEPADTVEPEPAPNACAACGFVNPVGSNFCIMCGKPLGR